MSRTPAYPELRFAAAPASSRLERRDAGRWLVPFALLTGLGATIAARWWATRAGLDGLAVGAIFGLALAGLTVAGRRPLGRPVLRAGVVTAAAVGVGFGLVLVVVVVAGAAITGAALVPGLARPAAPFLPWAAVTVLVAAGEEALLRGRLFDAVRRAGGLIPAVVLTTIAFAFMHVPLYGWHVVPLDLAVGLAFAGLRLATQGVAAPAAAHAVADLATWWL